MGGESKRTSKRRLKLSPRKPVERATAKKELDDAQKSVDLELRSIIGSGRTLVRNSAERSSTIGSISADSIRCRQLRRHDSEELVTGKHAVWMELRPDGMWLLRREVVGFSFTVSPLDERLAELAVLAVLAELGSHS
jgi:hypothetical protein